MALMWAGQCCSCSGTTEKNYWSSSKEHFHGPSLDDFLSGSKVGSWINTVANTTIDARLVWGILSSDHRERIIAEYLLVHIDTSYKEKPRSCIPSSSNPFDIASVTSFAE